MISLDIPVLSGGFAVGKRGWIDDDQVKENVRVQVADEGHGITALESVLPFTGNVVQFEVATGPIKISGRQIHGQRRAGIAVRGVDGKRTGVTEEVKEPTSFGHLPHHRACLAMIEEETCVDEVQHVRGKLESALLNNQFMLRLALPFVLKVATLSAALLQRDLRQVNFQRIGCGSFHQIQPIRVFGHCPFMGPGKLR